MNPNEPEFKLGEGKGKLLYVVTDVTKAESVNAMVEKAKATFGKLDILVNNAGINIPCLLVDPKDPHASTNSVNVSTIKSRVSTSRACTSWHRLWVMNLSKMAPASSST